MENTQSGGGTSTGNSSDFVRKLYKMLEDPSYAQIVRWGDDRDSFVVLECEKFTKSILPKHFKHSNFASFVRQLNKYDFHKVRQNNEETGQSPYGPGAWEFKHPEFKADNKDSLDNIRRKAPAPRKPPQSAEDSIPTQQLDLMNQQIVAQQQQFQHLADRFAVDQQLMMQEIRRVQKTVLGHEQVIHYMMTFLHSVDARQRRENRAAAAAFQGQPGSSELSPAQAQAQNDEPASPLQHAMKLLSEMNSEIQFNLSSLESMGEMQNRLPGAVPTPPLDQTQRNGTVRPPTSTGPASAMAFPKLNGDLEQVVYPVGVTNGIDPMYGDHINSIPYTMSTKEADPSDPRRQFVDRKKSTGTSTYADPGWIRSPHILLVEDDQTCRQIGGKFLYSFSCVIDTAFDGLEAVNKIQSGSKYDLILMDIIMPNLDGVSACSVIRRFDATPIIAMTSNIRSSDIELYFQNGMNDVLPKPFTRQSLLNMLEKHLVHLKNIPTAIDATQSAPPTAIPQNSATQSVKEETTPGQSPGTSIGNWQSPAQFPGVSPINVSIPNQFMQQQAGAPATPFTIDQNGGIQYPGNQMGSMNVATAPRTSHRRQMSDISSGADAHNLAKRQRMFATPANNTVVNPMQTNRMP
ncbi:kinase-regulated stress-responsive transcription factor skn7 [Coccidioides posadasii str. Silveira]|uniref:Transcription factor n=3 Tax=Coccidioides posadasii TaxID=199306 RepID=E9DJD9_COCPS|nr:HSF-type DNA-binding domain containing protein [Coccidioides posadasii C735 delta SOWgp]EER23380.1 HSF-type DNA-binding domain containing protein [Coccidioides posadasii C735 delta SOWgp]EFW13486.1 stress response transcription factor SrrA/Skn7 [Coccidioides posadasii str. Silveira]KMM64730.1 transcription factor prr1 [Coccidioides posadasii RMSCC 3488]QVM06777.1 kinase-regulated stress-responsive transcription factor skn7 [Coccidioides posadasii str. Silveira]|eukprot:XP_003065525.1 HSF-type DNA-binding domain containing protein [Coccidioides posadasii C735 delta SOWgp]